MEDLDHALVEVERFQEIIRKQSTASPRDASLRSDLYDAGRFKGDLLLKSGSQDLARKQFQDTLDELAQFETLVGKNVFSQEAETLRKRIAACTSKTAD